jgi:hypothetical protein
MIFGCSRNITLSFVGCYQKYIAEQPQIKNLIIHEKREYQFKESLLEKIVR